MRTVTYDENENQILPVKLTDEMLTAALMLCPDIWLSDLQPLYDAIRSAAPDHPATAGDAEDAARLDRMESALDQIQAWASAYPIGMFPEPNWAASAKVLKDAGLSLDAISAANMRHVITRVQEIADNAMRASKGGE